MVLRQPLIREVILTACPHKRATHKETRRGNAMSDSIKNERIKTKSWGFGVCLSLKNVACPSPQR